MKNLILRIANCFAIFVFIMMSIPVSAQVKSGPMPGYSAMKEVMVWVQLEESADVHLEWRNTVNMEEKGQSPVVKTKQKDEFVAHLIATGLEPGQVYQYEIHVNGSKVDLGSDLRFKTQELWQWRKDAPDFTFLAGSCAYINETQYDRPGRPYGGNYEIFENMAKEDADFMFWLGDNIYLREVDWDSRSGIFHRYNVSRALPELQNLLMSMHHYAIWDDHDYGPNDSDASYWGKHHALDAFKLFWANNGYGIGNTEGITGYFSWSDCDFFLMDNRWYRTAQNPDGTILGDAQMAWLIDALRFSTAPFKFVAIGGQVLNSAKVFENHSNFVEERARIISEIDKYGIKNVVFLTGDRHHSEVSMIKSNSGLTLYDITSSPLTSGTRTRVDENNENRIDGSFVLQRNYSKITISGKRGERTLKLSFHDINGKELYTYSFESEK